MDKNTLIKVMLDYRHNSIERYSQEDAKESIRKALIEANGGSTKVDRKAFRRNTELYDIVEEFIVRVADDGVKSSDFFNTLCEQRNIAEGDELSFVIESNSVLTVADAAKGTRGIRRQRIGETTSVAIKPVTKVIKVYDEITRILSGKADINVLADKAAKAIAQGQLDDIYAALNGITATTIGADYYPTAGAYSEDKLFDLVNHVSAANNGANVILVCTPKGARAIKATDDSTLSKEDVYNYGYARKWNGYTVQVVPQRHKVGTDTFVFDDDKVYVLPVTMDKPIKQVISGDVELTFGDTTDNADATVEASIITAWGTGIVTSCKFGVYEMA